MGVHDPCMVEERLMSMKRIETNITSLQYLKTVSIVKNLGLGIILRINIYLNFFYTNDEDYLLL